MPLKANQYGINVVLLDQPAGKCPVAMGRE